ncbi:protein DETOXIFICATION 45, chloroplastic-like isoform X2 [Arachis hypogaea]|uniref:protein DETOXIFICATION 45, chloroplastic-like isoform X2 n=1 Tax=Arachis hypogaea TaxID=3818 RepID=UPI000DEC1141|nr:protein DETOXIFICATION 45, chloroplastic-like isoform X2 [Arachis hypogaea]XP_025698253.1 protein DETOXIFICATION 45, chloroplastic-like isoform X2 [Arachis hypogaea]QHO40309.1 Protein DETOXIFICATION 45 [Arachis hypogaea]
MATQIGGSLVCGVAIEGVVKRTKLNNEVGKCNFHFRTATERRAWNSIGILHKKVVSFDNFVRHCGLVANEPISDVGLSHFDVHNDDDDDSALSENGILINKKNFVFDGVNLENKPKVPSVQTELIMLSIPAIAGQAIEPLAQLMETAYIGRLGVLELASAGVSMSIFNIVSKVFNIPLLSVATSFVAEEIAAKPINNEGPHDQAKRMFLPSVSTALVLAAGIGMIEALAMFFGSRLFLIMVGISSDSPMRILSERFLSLRAIGAPAVVISLAVQGIFRGFKDTRTPVQCLGFGNLAAVFLFPVLIYNFNMGVAGAALSTVISQYIVATLMIWSLSKRTKLSIPNIRSLPFGGYLRSGGFLLGRTLASVMTITLSTTMAARLGPLATAAHQICLQVWLSVSLLVDAQGAAGQALVASFLAKGDYNTVKEVTYFALKIGVLTGVMLAIILGTSFGSLATLFTQDIEVLGIVKSGLLFVSASQPLTALAYIFDGLHYGVSDFSFAACSMMLVGAISSTFLLLAPSVIGIQGIWYGLALFMGLRTIAGIMRLLSKDGPWWFLQLDNHELKDSEEQSDM